MPIAVVAASSEVEGCTVAGRNADRARLDVTGVDAHPQSAMPDIDGGYLPTTDQIVEWGRGIASEVLSLAEGEIVDAIEGNIVGRNRGAVEVSEPQALRVCEVGLTESTVP